MTWNYRVMRYAPLLPGDDPFLAIHEVYYDAAGEVETWTHEAAHPGSDDLEGLAWVLAKMGEALQKPVLDFATGKPVQ